MENEDSKVLDTANAAASSLSRFAFSRLSIKSKIIILAAGILVLFLMSLAGSGSMSQLSNTYYLTPSGESEALRPSDSDKDAALSDITYARARTESLLEIIGDYKSKDKENQLEAIRSKCRQNDWDISRTMNMLSDEFEVSEEFSSQNNRVLAAFSISLDNGELIKSGLGYINQSGKPVKTYIFGEHKGEINYEKTLENDLKKFIQGNHFYTLTYEMQNGKIKVYKDVEVEYVPKEVDVLDEEGNPTGDTKTIYVPVYHTYYYVHPVLIERDTNAMAEEIFGLDTDAPYVNSVSHEGPAVVGERGVISNKEAITRISEATEELLYGVSGVSNMFYYSSFNGTYEWPVPGNVRITSLWGPRVHPITGKYSNHSGTDIAAPKGDPVIAADTGKVIFAGYAGTYGNLIKISHPDGNVTYYAHLSKILVYEGLEVERGQEIAKVGSTGQSTGPHLHFEVRINGNTVDGLPFICDREMYENLVFSL